MRRTSPSPTDALGGWLPGLAPLRGFAALAVALFHVSNAAGRARLDGGPVRDLAQAGYVGVDVFFVLSGLVLYLPVCRAGGDLGSLRRFWVRRVARVYPLYVLVLVAAVLLHDQLTTFDTPLPPSAAGWRLLLAHLTFTAQPVYGFFPWLTGLGVATVVWTLAVEAGFYLLLPLVARPFWRQPVAWLVGAVVVSRAWVGFGTHLERLHPGGIADPSSPFGVAQAQTHWTMQLPTYLAHFATGMALAVLLVRSEGTALGTWLRRRAGTIALVGLGLLLWWMRGDGRRTFLVQDAQWDHQVATWRVVPAMGLLVLGLAAAAGRLHRVLAAAPLQWLGETSYAFYLVHYPLIAVVQMRLHVPADGSTRSGLTLLLALPLAMALAGVLHRVYEVPARSVVRRALSPAAGRAPPTPAPRAPAPSRAGAGR